ncbi:hypothetical protein LNR78_004386 [Salmonella enterica]|nr:hypothetical protein [Salmonella enterica]ECO1003957.1 hypothetical protein [Salmonella enterica subsp. enterica serovar Give]ECY3797577.1 hypothetical protein [Salmonella enterica subsp. enterica serovar Minnesota]EDL3544261.1 hypothetical protein [Salmonella enterica subsp. enterica serovar Newport]EDQ6948648.1 hypothetical protein [Salmonella enterica subsp. enterica serovar 9,12:-:1,5]EDR7365412.1 hypothetical protein [Salmonella enterica subsp. enterica serovar Oslo]EDU8777391.1 hypot
MSNIVFNATFIVSHRKGDGILLCVTVAAESKTDAKNKAKKKLVLYNYYNIECLSVCVCEYDYREGVKIISDS